jgi:hypothetical protein
LLKGGNPIFPRRVELLLGEDDAALKLAQVFLFHRVNPLGSTLVNQGQAGPAGAQINPWDHGRPTLE